MHRDPSIEELEAGQGERLSVRLKSLIRGYPVGPGLVKEFVQNADDAAAGHVRIILDRRTHTCQQLSDPTELYWVGPALLVCNDSTFTAADFEAIQNIGESSKFNAGVKTGRFGIGFNIAYNVTDYPCLLSGDRLLFFDPHKRHRQAQRHRPGGGWRLSQGLWARHPDLLAPFTAGGLSHGATHHPGTIFRFPLRTPEQAATSEICDLAFRPDDFLRIVDGLAGVAGELLLFLKFVQSITVEEVGETSTEPHPVLAVTTANGDEVRDARNRVNAFVSAGECGEILERLRDAPAEAPSVAFRHEIQVRHRDRERTELWQVASGLYVDEDGEVLDAAHDILGREGKALPWAGAAIRLMADREGGTRATKIDGRLNCFLPLSRPTKLPVHLNGFFDLGSSRDWITDDTANQGKDADRVEWNRCLLRHGVSRAYAAALASLSAGGDGAVTDPSGYYDLWPDATALEGLLAEVLPAAYAALANGHTVRTADGGWAMPKDLWVPPADRPDLQAPLVAQGMPVPDPPLPPHVVEGFGAAGVDFDPLEPSTVREQLRVEHDVNVPPGQSSEPWLRRREWLVSLLHFCVSDGLVDDLAGVPLALLDDGRLHTFGRSKLGTTFIAGREEKGLFPDCPGWFLDSEYIRGCEPLRPSGPAKIDRMDADDVLLNLSAVLDRDGHKQQRAWDPGGPTLPNERWLIDALEYLVRHASDISVGMKELLRGVPCVPDRRGHLCTAGRAHTPLLPSAELLGDEKLMAALDRLGVPLVGGSAAMIRTIRQFAARFDSKGIIWPLTGPDLVDTLIAFPELVQAVPSYDPAVHDVLLDFLGRREWDGKYDEEQLQGLRELRILPTVGGRLVSAATPMVYLPATGSAVPDTGSDIQLVNTGRGRWVTLLRQLGLPILDGATFIRQVLIPSYPKLDTPRRVEVLGWLQDNLSRIRRQLERDNPGEAEELQQSVVDAALVESDDGVLRPAGELYHPGRPVVRQVLGNRVPYPHPGIYADREERWLQFFLELGMSEVPRPQDLLYYIEDLIDEGRTGGADGVADRLLSVYYHLSDEWDRYADAAVEDVKGNARPIAEVLGVLEWLPAQRDEKKLRQYFAAAIPERKLCSPAELYPARLGHLVASQAAIADFREPTRAMRDALGFPKRVPLPVLLEHFDCLVASAAALGPQVPDQVLRRIRKSLFGVYVELGRASGSATVEEGDVGPDAEDAAGDDAGPTGDLNVTELQRLYAGRKCIWHDPTRTFWEPERAYRSAAWFLQPLRQQIRIDEPPAADAGLTALGRRDEPSLDDLLECVREYAAAAAGGAVDGSVTVSVLRLYRKIGELLDPGAAPGSSGLDTLPILTASNHLVPADQVLEEDTLRFQGKFDPGHLHLVHPEVDVGVTRAAGVCKLSDAVTEELADRPIRIEGDDFAEDCRQVTQALRTDAFAAGLQRLVQADRGRGYLARLDWLRSVCVVPVDAIHTTLTLRRPDGYVVQDAGEPGFFVVPAGHTIYLTRQVHRQRAFYLAHALNLRLGEDRLRDLSHLLLILTLEPDQIDLALTRAYVRRPVTFDQVPGSDTGGSDPAGGVVYREDGDDDTIDAGDAPVAGDAADPSPPDGPIDVPDPVGVGDDHGGRDESPDADVDEPQDEAVADDMARTDEGPPVRETTSPTDLPGARVHADGPGPAHSGVTSDTAAREPASSHRSEVTEGGGTSREAPIPPADGHGRHGSRDPDRHTDRGGGGRQPGTGGDRPLARGDQAYTTTSDAAPRPRPEAASGEAGPSPAPRQPSVRRGRAVTYVVPEGQRTEPDHTNDEEKQNMRISRSAVEAVLADERSDGWDAAEKPHNNPGYDVVSTRSETGERRYIEVKGIEGGWGTMGVPLSKTQVETARKLGDDFWLYVVEFACDPGRRRIHRVRNPYQQITQFRFDSGWAALAVPRAATPPAPADRPAVEPRRGQRVQLPNGQAGTVESVRQTMEHTTVTLVMADGRKRQVLWNGGIKVVE